MKQFVRDLKPGNLVDSLFAVTAKKEIPFRDPERGRYMSVILSDRTGRIPGRLWDGSEEVFSGIRPNCFVRVKGAVEEFKGSKQIRISSIEPVRPGATNRGDFIGESPRDREALKKGLKDLVRSIRDPHIKRLLKDWFSEPEFLGAYLNSPAAKHIHHSYLGGLLEHSLEVWRVLETVIGMRPQLDRDLLAAGALLHDVGKIKDYKCGHTIELTDEGQLIGHTALGYEMVMERIRRYEDFPGKTALHLGHLILSHHGQLEYGATVLPKTVEACALHHADLLSSRVQPFLQVTERHDQAEGTWTPYDRFVGGQVYVGFAQKPGDISQMGHEGDFRTKVVS